MKPRRRSAGGETARFLAPLLLAAALAACSGLLGLGGDRLDDARDRWRDSRPALYQFTYRRICFCLGTDPVVVTVEGDSVTRVGPAPGSDPNRVPPRKDIRTVGGLFELLREWEARDPHSQRVRYHDELGYPVEAFFDFEENVADEEMGFEVSDLRAVAGLEQ